MPWIILGLLVLTALAICVLMFRLLQSRDRLHAFNRQLETWAQTDVLTGVRNRRATTTALTRLLGRAQRNAQPLGVLMVDVDYFKRVNDTFGHAVGDAVLIEVADRLSRTLRTGDDIGRWGGEEFVILLPDTDHETAAAVGNRLRVAVGEAPIRLGPSGDDLTVTVSIGSVSCVASSAEVIVAAADRALYLAKAAGRNVVRSAAC